MLIGFFLHLKSVRLPVSTREFLTLLEALEARVVSLSIDEFYHLARASLIKDEALFDRYDVALPHTSRESTRSSTSAPRSPRSGSGGSSSGCSRPRTVRRSRRSVVGTS